MTIHCTENWTFYFTRSDLRDRRAGAIVGCKSLPTSNSLTELDVNQSLCGRTEQSVVCVCVWTMDFRLNNDLISRFANGGLAVNG